jgi:hypothetical protein
MALIAPLPPILDRRATDGGDEPILGPNNLVSALGKKLSSSLAVCLWKLRLDDNNVLNAHVSLLGSPKAIIREYQTSL